MKLKNWIRRSFRNRVFATILVVTLVPLLLCDVVMMQVIVARAEHTQARQARAALDTLSQRFDEAAGQCGDTLEALATSTITRSVLRRTGKTQSVLTAGAVRVDTDRACVTKNGQELPLSALEYRLLLVFLTHRGQTLTRAKLLEEIWDVAGDFVNDNTLTVYIKRLRDKLEDDPQEPALIRTVRGVGYRLEDTP